MTQERPHEPAPPDTAGPAGGRPAEDLPEQAAPHPPASLQTLRQAMRRARNDDAERTSAIADLRAARIGRLELLEDALAPLQAQIPADVDLFDFGLMAGAQPRLFLDMIGFVEMGRNARTYRLVQDTRHGRKLLAESDSMPRMVEAVTDYVARRLLERDKALAADGEEGVSEAPARTPPSARPAPGGTRPARRPRRLRGIAGAAFGFLITVLGVITFFTVLFAVLFYAALQIWPKLSELWPNLFGQS